MCVLSVWMIQPHVVVIAACPHRGLAHRGRYGLQFPNNKQSLVPWFDRRECVVLLELWLWEEKWSWLSTPLGHPCKEFQGCQLSPSWDTAPACDSAREGLKWVSHTCPESQQVLGGHRESTSARQISCYCFWKGSSPCSWSLQVQSDKHGGRFSVRADHHLTNSTCSIRRGPEPLQAHLRLISTNCGLGHVLKQHKKPTHLHIKWVRKRRVEILEEPCLGPV